jgi:hypothetical protein
MESGWDWKVIKTSFSRLEIDLRQLATMNYEIYQIVSVHEVKPAKMPFEVVIIGRKRLGGEELRTSSAGAVQPTFEMNYRPLPEQS